MLTEWHCTFIVAIRAGGVEQTACFPLSQACAKAAGRSDSCDLVSYAQVTSIPRSEYSRMNIPFSQSVHRSRTA